MTNDHPYTLAEAALSLRYFPVTPLPGEYYLGLGRRNAPTVYTLVREGARAGRWRACYGLGGSAYLPEAIQNLELLAAKHNLEIAPGARHNAPVHRPPLPKSARWVGFAALNGWFYLPHQWANRGVPPDAPRPSRWASNQDKVWRHVCYGQDRAILQALSPESREDIRWRARRWYGPFVGDYIEELQQYLQGATIQSCEATVVISYTAEGLPTWENGPWKLPALHPITFPHPNAVPVRKAGQAYESLHRLFLTAPLTTPAAPAE
jgi:hypothetical protein